MPQALVCALTASSYQDTIRNPISIGGDSETIAAIASGVGEALFGIPQEVGQKGWTYLPYDMRCVLQGLFRKAGVETGSYPFRALTSGRIWLEWDAKFNGQSKASATDN